ncbi:hypothetical protein [Lacinutrix sp.]|uniref:hypothetical protein n=1 Tax=Lacinutrix sp. TaxID=1937692 RepID=UPI0025B83137|nr:hypothetical protein [Lacinutrix sp.]
MKKTIYLAILALITLASCSKENDFIYNEESSDLQKIINVSIFDETSKKEITTEYLKSKWENKILEQDGYDVELEKFEIIQSTDNDTKEIYYFLKSISKNRTIETGAFLIKIGEGQYKMGAKQCSCAGCRTGCRLTITGSNCDCSKCPPGKACTKTETAIVGG